MEKTLLTTKELAERWGVDVTSIRRMEQEGAIHRVKKLKGVKFSIREIEIIENSTSNDAKELTLINYKKMENDRNYWKNEYLKLKNAVDESARNLVQVLTQGG